MIKGQASSSTPKACQVTLDSAPQVLFANSKANEIGNAVFLNTRSWISCKSKLVESTQSGKLNLKVPRLL